MSPGTRKNNSSSASSAKGKQDEDKTSAASAACAIPKAKDGNPYKKGNRVSSPKKSPSTPPKTGNSSAKADSEPASPTTLRGTTVATCKTRCGSIVALTKKNGTQGAYLSPLLKWLTNEDHQEFTEKALKITYIGNQTDPNNRNFPLEDEPGKNSTYRPRHPVFVAVLSDDNVDKNTPEMRRKFAENIMKVNNSDNMQRAYIETSANPQRGGTMLSYAGDITPKEEGQLPFLSKYLPRPEVIECIKAAYKANDGSQPSLEFVLKCDEWLTLYFEPEEIPLVKQFYGFSTDESEDVNECDGISVSVLDL